MKTIKFNGRKLKVPVDIECGLRIIAENGYAVKLSDMWYGKPRYLKSYLPQCGVQRLEFGVVEKSKSMAKGRGRVAKFFKSNPRCNSALFGEKRRIDAILKKCDAA